MLGEMRLMSDRIEQLQTQTASIKDQQQHMLSEMSHRTEVLMTQLQQQVKREQ